MSRCKRFKKMVSDYIEENLLQKDKKLFEEHLDDCPGCYETVDGVKKLKHSLTKLSTIRTSEDFDTILRTRIKIESGIGRRRLHEIIWNWPTKIPVYGMSIALIIIAFILVMEQVKNPNYSAKPDAYVNPEWYGGNPADNNAPISFEETENYLYVIERTSPDNLYTNGDHAFGEGDSINTLDNDSLTTPEKPIKQVNQVTY